MQYKFLNFFLEKKDLLSQNSEMIDSVLLENNKSQIDDFYEFYKTNSPVLYINGFLGTGKVQLADYSLNFLSNETIVLKYNCFETTILDDIFLGFFEEFKKLQSQKIIDAPKIRTENFTQKINAYFTFIERPFVIILDSFESLTEENRKEIVDFILHISSFNKVKTVIIGRTFKSGLFPENFKVERITTTALDKPLFEKYLKSNKIKHTNHLLDEFYKHTRGYYFFTKLSLTIIKQKEIDLELFMDTFKKSFATFYEYLLKESMDIIPAISVRFFWVLCLLRHGVTIPLLKQLNLYDEENLNFLCDINMITVDKSQIYVQDYFREQMDASIPQNVKLKLHQLIINLYESQLPLKPLERNILLSRQTMRNEIEYHSLFIPKKQIKTSDKNDLSYITYTKEKELEIAKPSTTKSELDKDVKEELKNWISTKKHSNENKENYKGIDLKNIEIDLKDLPFKLTEQEMELLSAEPTNENFSSLQTNPESEEPEEQIELTLSDILEYAKEQENSYKYPKMIELYLKALTYESDKDYYLQLPIIYTKLGFGYQKMSDWDNSIKYYELAKEFYEQTQEKIKENYINLSISNIYYETYKPDKAKNILLSIINTDNNPEILTAKAYISLANIEDSLSNINSAYEYYNMAIKLSTPAMDAETLSELYFKYALTSDDKNESETAKEYYEKCIKVESDYKINKFLSAAYSNLATLHLEKNDVAYAVKNYLKAYEIDEKNNNFDGMYFSASKLAQALQKKYPEKALEYYKNAKECAKKLNDIFYLASSSLALGDFYYNRKEDDFALKEYFWALELVKNDFSKDNLNKINMRIDDIKFRIGTERFNKMENNFKNEQR